MAAIRSLRRVTLMTPHLMNEAVTHEKVLGIQYFGKFNEERVNDGKVKNLKG